MWLPSITKILYIQIVHGSWVILGVRRSSKHYVNTLLRETMLHSMMYALGRINLPHNNSKLKTGTIKNCDECTVLALVPYKVVQVTSTWSSEYLNNSNDGIRDWVSKGTVHVLVYCMIPG